MANFLIFILGLALIVQAFIGLSFFISSIWEREKRAGLLGGLQFLGMLVLVILFFSLNAYDFFEKGAGLGIMICALIAGILGCLLFFMRIGTNPAALQGTKGSIVGTVKRWDERDIEFSKMFQKVVKMAPPDAFSSPKGKIDMAGAILETVDESAPTPPGTEKEGPPEKDGRITDEFMNSLNVETSINDPNLGKIDGQGRFANAAMTNASMAVVGDFVDPKRFIPPVSPMKIDISPEEASLRIKGYLKNLGACLSGITELDPQWLYTRYGFSGRSLREWGKEVDIDHKYAIVFAEEMDNGLIGAGPHSSTTLETTHNYAKGAFIGVQIARFIANLGYSAKAHHAGHYDAMMVPLAVDAGLGELGRMGYLISKEFGPRIRLSAVTTDLPLVKDRPVDIGVVDFCNKCKKCATCCPSHSIPEGDREEINGSVRWKLNSETCIGYWQKVGSDCAVCMRVCPWSHERTFPHKIIVEAVSRNKFSRSLFNLMDDVFYGSRPKPKDPPEWAHFRVSSPASPEDEEAKVEGTWEISMNTPMGPQTATITLVDEGGTFTGTMTSPMGEESDLQNVNIDGNRVGFKADLNSPMEKMTLGVSGVVKGDTISGDFETPMGPNPFSGERK